MTEVVQNSAMFRRLPGDLVGDFELDCVLALQPLVAWPEELFLKVF